MARTIASEAPAPAGENNGGQERPEGDTPGFGGGDELLLSYARQLYQARADANRLFGARVLADPRLDMLVWLYMEPGRAGVPVSTLCTAGNVAMATGLRQIAKLEDFGLIERRADPKD